MGTEEAKQEEAKAPEASKQEDKPVADEKQKEEEEKKPQVEKKEETKPSPPPPIILFVHLHCVGCAKKIERSILKCRGVEEVETNMEKNEVTVKGIVDPQALCSRIQKKTSRNAKVVSPLPPADSTKPESLPPHEAALISTVELLVNMHCEACAQQLRKKIMKMRGVQSAETDLSAKKVTVTGTMNGDKLVEYIYRRAGKIARIVPPPPQEEEKKTEKGDKKAEEKSPPPEEKKEEDKAEEKKEQGEKPTTDASAEASKEEVAAAQAMNSAEEMVKRMMYWSGGGGYVTEEEMAKRMTMMHWLMPTAPVPMYVMERPQLPPPPQIFSDENPNACCIS